MLPSTNVGSAASVYAAIVASDVALWLSWPYSPLVSCVTMTSGLCRRILEAIAWMALIFPATLSLFGEFWPSRTPSFHQSHVASIVFWYPALLLPWCVGASLNLLKIISFVTP